MPSCRQVQPLNGLLFALSFLRIIGEKLFISVRSYFSMTFFLPRTRDKKQHVKSTEWAVQVDTRTCTHVCTCARTRPVRAAASYPSRGQRSCWEHSAGSSPPGCTGQTRCPRRAAGCWAGPAGSRRGRTPGRWWSGATGKCGRAKGQCHLVRALSPCTPGWRMMWSLDTHGKQGDRGESLRMQEA